MKFAAFAVGVAALMSTSAMAADLSVAPYMPAYAAPVASGYDWTGFYAGLHGGLVKGDSSMDLVLGNLGPTPTTFSKTYDPAGGFLGIHAGYLYQLDNNLALGVEADADWMRAQGSLGQELNPLFPMAFFGTSTLNWTASLRARLGYTMDRTMVYLTGGVAFADYDFGYSVSGPPDQGVYNETVKRVGYTIGGGVSQAFTDDIVGHVEYRFSDYGRHDFQATSQYFNPAGSIDLKTHALRTGISLKF